MLSLLWKYTHTHARTQLEVIQATWFSFPVEPAAVVFLLSIYESLAPLSLWHCPIFPLSVCLSISFSHSACFSAACTLSFWTMTLRDSCNVRRLAILAGAFESRGSREGEGLYLRLGALTSLITLFFFLLLSYSVFMSTTVTHFLPTNRSQELYKNISQYEWKKMSYAVYTFLIQLCPQFSELYASARETGCCIFTIVI